MSLPPQETLVELTAFEGLYLKDKEQKHAANLTISYNDGKESCKSDRMKIRSRSAPLGSLIEPKTQSNRYILDLSHFPPSVVKRLVCFLHIGHYKNAAAKCTIGDHLEMIRFGEQHQILSLQGFAARELLASWWEWWENGNGPAHFGVCVGSIPVIYGNHPPTDQEGICRVRGQLCLALDFPLSRYQLRDLQRYGGMYPLFKRDMLTELDIDLNRIFE